MKKILSLTALTVLAASFALGQEMTRPTADGKPEIYSPTEIKWQDGRFFARRS